MDGESEFDGDGILCRHFQLAIANCLLQPHQSILIHIKQDRHRINGDDCCQQSRIESSRRPAGDQITFVHHAIANLPGDRRFQLTVTKIDLCRFLRRLGHINGRSRFGCITDSRLKFFFRRCAFGSSCFDSLQCALKLCVASLCLGQIGRCAREISFKRLRVDLDKQVVFLNLCSGLKMEFDQVSTGSGTQLNFLFRFNSPSEVFVVHQFATRRK